MGLMELLGKAYNTLEKHSPEIMDYMSKAVELAEKTEERNRLKQVEIEKYKVGYLNLSNAELKNKLDTESGIRKDAVISLLQDRKREIAKCKSIYSDLSDSELRVELHMLDIRATHFGDKKGQRLSAEETEMRKNVVIAILKQRGVY